MAKEQAFLANGLMAIGTAIERENFCDHPELLVSTIRLWAWRRVRNGLEVLVRKRSMSKKSYPDMLDISAAGHRDEDEETIVSVIREAREEIGREVDPQNLEFAFSLRKINVSNCIATVYLYGVDDQFVPHFDDGEVESAEWLGFADFSKITSDSESNNFANHDTGYFTLLPERLCRL